MTSSIHKNAYSENLSMFFLTLFLFIQISACLHWDGNILYDLETNTLSGFTTETADWTLSSYKTAGVKFSNCAGNYIMGGYNVLGGTSGQYFQRTYPSLPTHNQIYIQMKFYQLDSWDFVGSQLGFDYFSISIDGTSITGWYFYSTYSGTSPLCGNPGNSIDRDYVFTFSLAYPHSASSLILKLITYSDEDSSNESFGFRDIKIEFLTNSAPYFSLCAPGVPSSYLSSSRCSTSCTTSGNSIQPANYGFCLPSSFCSADCQRCSDTTTTCTLCHTGSYLVGTTCYPACDYPLSTKTLGGGVLYCETPCPGQYVWWDQSCSPSCSYTTAYGSYAMVGITVNSFLECTYQCATNEYLYANTSCLSSCPSPLISTTYKGEKFCEYPCGSSQYLYWNGSCINSCPSPLAPEIQGTFQQRNFCWYPCPDTEYLYWNGSCIATCPSPLASEIQGTFQQRKFCWYSCQPSQYLYWNGSCINNCPSPLAPETQGTSQQRNFCWYTCPETDYLYWNGSCINTCPSPLSPETQGTSQQRKFCWYTCSETQYLYWNGSCINSCPSPLAPEIQGTSQQRNFCWYPCPDIEYLYWNGSCMNTCPSPLAPETQGTSQQRKFCWYTCSETQYLYWNGSCINSCPSPLAPEIQGTSQQRNFCWYPCPYTEYLFWNGSCMNTCPSPLAPETQGTSQQRKFCWYSCQPSQYLYWNESCIDTCPYPLTPEKQQGASSSRNFCWYSCAETHYSYWNGSCINTCPSPLSPEIQGITKQRNFCWYTCQPSEYLYWNQSCSSRCPIPLLKFNLSGNLFCFLPCDMPNIYWYQDFYCRKECNFPYNLIYRDSVYQCLKPCPRASEYFYDLEKKCHDTCELPYARQLINGIRVCHITASTLSSEIQKIETIAGILEPLGQVTSTILKIIMIPELSSSRSPLLVQLSTIVQYIRYMRINYPWRLRLLFEANGDKLISLNFDFNIPNWVQDKLDDYPLPDVFEKYDLESNFINNLWDLMTTALLVIFVLLVLLLLRRLLSNYRKICYIITRIIQSLRWNTLLAMICADSGDIIFYASLHIRNTPLGSIPSIVSLIIVLLMIFFVIVVLGICFRILLAFHLQKQKRTPDWLEKWKGYEILYEEIEQDSLFSLAYMAIYIIRSIIFFAIIANLYEYPFIQSILLNAINLSIFGYLLNYKPLQDRLNIIQLFINEILGDIELVCVLALAQMDREGTDDPYAAFNLGNIIIVIIIIFYVLGVVFLAFEGICFLIKAFKTWKEMRAQGIRNPFKMAKILLFGELSKIHHQEPTLDLSQNSSMISLNTTEPPAHFHNNYFQKPQNHLIIHSGSQIRARRPRIVSEIPSRPSPQRFTPFRDSKPSAQNTELEIQVSPPNRVVTRIPKNKARNYHNIQEEIIRNRKINRNRSQNQNRNQNPSGFILQNFDPSLQLNINFTRNQESSNARIKRSSHPVHQPDWRNK